MHWKNMSFLGAAVLLFLATGGVLGERGTAEAAVVSVSRANVEGNIAENDETTKTLQEIIDDDATYVGDRDILNFAPGEYKDAGELLVTRPLTLRKTPGSEGDVKFTGKVMINIKSDDVVVEGLTFKDVTVPDVVTARLDLDSETAGNQPLLYGFPGKKLAVFLEEQISDFTLDENGFWCNYDEDEEEATGPVSDYTDDDTCSSLPHNDERWVTVAGSSVAADNGKIASKYTGMPVTYDSHGTFFEIHSEGIPSATAKNGLGTIWVDAFAPDACETDGATPPVEVAEITGVVIRGNTFDGTEVAAIRGGDQSHPQPIINPTTGMEETQPICLNFLCTSVATTYIPCRTELDVIANTFMNVGGTGGFAKDSAGNLFEDAAGNRIAEVGNREPAIDLGKVARAKVTDNTIDGGTWDAVVLARTPEGARVDIRNNLITNTILDGIEINGDKKPEAVNPRSETRITVTGNRVTGTSMNRYITLHNTWEHGPEDPYYGERDQCFLVNEGLAEDFFTYRVEGDSNSPRDVWTQQGQRTANRLLAPEIWRSARPGFGFDYRGAPASNLKEDGSLKYFIDRDSGYFDEEDVVGDTALVRISAERCYTSRIKVVRQEGVSIIGNDLGYAPDFSGNAPRGVPDYGLAVIGMDTPLTLAAFSGNNIGFFRSAAVLSTTGKAIPTNGNYMRVPRVQTGTSLSLAALDARVSEPVVGTADAPRVIGPRESVLNPDRTLPVLTKVEVNAAGTMITLTYSKTLDGRSRPDADDFTVRSCAPAVCAARFKSISVSGVTVSDATVTLALGDSLGEIETGDTVTVTYSGGAIRDVAGNVAASITTSQTVTNNVGRAPAPAPGTTDGPGTQAPGGGGDGGCALASAGKGRVDPGMLLPFMVAGLAFGLRRRGVGARRN